MLKIAHFASKSSGHFQQCDFNQLSSRKPKWKQKFRQRNECVVIVIDLISSYAYVYLIPFIAKISLDLIQTYLWFSFDVFWLYTNVHLNGENYYTNRLFKITFIRKSFRFVLVICDRQRIRYSHVSKPKMKEKLRLFFFFLPLQIFSQERVEMKWTCRQQLYQWRWSFL